MLQKRRNCFGCRTAERLTECASYLATKSTAKAIPSCTGVTHGRHSVLHPTRDLIGYQLQHHLILSFMTLSLLTTYHLRRDGKYNTAKIYDKIRIKIHMKTLTVYI